LHIECRCLIDECEDVTSDEFEPQWLNNTIPWDEIQTTAGCHRYASIRRCIRPPLDGITVTCQNHFYDKSLFRSTIVTDVNIFSRKFQLQSNFGAIFCLLKLFGAKFEFVLSGSFQLKCQNCELQFDLSCDNEWKQTLTGTVYMAGMLFGALACGSVADR